MKAHQLRVVGPVAVTQQVPAEVRFAPFAVEPQCCINFPLRGLLTVGAVGYKARLTPREFGEYGVLLVGGQQESAGLAAGVVFVSRRVKHAGAFLGEIVN
jgi:hypothetical protein